MKLLFKNKKHTLSIFLTALMVCCTHISSYADITPVKDRTPQVRDVIVAAVPDVNNADDVTAAHLANIKKLDLSKKGISELKAGDFDGLSALQTIRLTGNQLHTLPTEIFSGLSSLRHLFLDNNQLTNVPEELFDGLSSLRHLYLNNNQLTNVPEELFNGLSSLLQINAHSNKLTSLPSDVFSGVPSLIQLYLGNNQLKSVPQDLFKKTPTLQSLHLTDNRFTTFPAGVFSGLSSLQYLLLSGNRMSTLPDGVFRGMDASTWLWLHNNAVDPLPLTVSLEKVGTNQFKATAPAGAPFPMTLSLTVANGSIGGGVATLTIPAGNVESQTLTVIRTSGTTDAVTVDIGTFPGLPANHQGYALTKSDSLPMTIIEEIENRAPMFTEATSKAPSITEAANITRSIAENTSANTNIGAPVAATDADNDSLTYTLGGTDASSFSIVSTSGQLQTKAPLDYETKSSYSVIVSVSDADGESDSITVTINVTDVEENRAPAFTEGDNTTRSIAENTDSDTNIGAAIAATDADSDTLTYTLGGTDASSFSIVSTSGQLKTSAVLDYEAKSSYSVTITVSDSELTDTIDVTINVTDVDENRAPSFTDGSTTTRSVAENTGSGQDIGSAVAATDPDTGDTLTYTLGGKDAASFSIDSTNGQLQTSGALDYEAKSSYTVRITVSDSKLTDTIDVTINVTNINEAPSFTEGSTATRSIAENTAASTNIGTAISAADVDANTTLTYTLGGADASSFSIVSTSGQLQTNAALDYEAKSSYSVTITVSDSELTDSIDVTIDVTDVDENRAPSFSEGNRATRSIAENTGSGQDIGSAVSATDPDNDTLTYILGGKDAESFRIDDTNGQLQTRAALDYETKTSYTVTITVSDSELIDTIDVTINVTDVDENRAPEFNAGSSTTRSIAENTGSGVNIGSPVAATDADTSNTLTYTLGGTDESSFSIVDTNGQLQTKAALDYETKASYSVKVSVSDGNGSSDSIDVTISVTNVNEAPSFTEGSTATRSIAENTASGENIGTAISATDVDTNTTLIYTLGGTDAAAFRINSTNGRLKTRAALDYETKTSYTVTITVSDSELTDTIDVTINVTDVDENRAPAFTDGSTTTRSVAENTGSGEDIGTAVAATDPDDDTLTYTLSGTDAASFSIVSTSGQLQTNAALDYETKSSYSVTVSVSDGNGGSDSISVNVNVTDVDENRAPVFTEGDSTTRSIDENTASGVNIGSAVSATDPDDDTLTYTVSGTDAASFSIVSTSGQLQTNAALNYESKSSYSVTVEVSDGNGGSDSIPVTISVTDVNEAPSFATDTATRSIAENTASGEDIGNAVTATDPDTGDTLTYTLGGANAAAFSIVSTSGQLRTNAALDYETKSSYSVTVSVSDGNGGNDSISVTINVTDVNERLQQIVRSAPVFTEGTSTTRTVAENTASGTDIGTAVAATISTPVAATDADNDALTYTLGGTDAAAFSIVSTSGQLRTLAVLDYETKSSYTVTITASDGTLTDTISVTINVTDVDENRAPVFTEGDSTTRAIAEHTYSGTDIGTPVAATDADGDTLTYWLEDETSFSIVSNTGQLQTKVTLDYETQSSYTVTITASDGTLTDTISVTINVTDLDESRFPTFTEGDSTTRSIAENADPGVDIGSPVTATDPDTGDTLTYSLGGTEVFYYFTIVPTSGQLRSRYPFNYERKASYSVTVFVSDGNGGTDSISVTINVTDVNEAPRFTESVSTIRTVAENTASGQNIGSAVSATDPDTGDTLTYSLSGTDAASFSIVSTNGQLRTKAALDYETKSIYSVTITVSDGSLTDSISVTISVAHADGTTIDPPLSERTQQVRDAIVRAAKVDSVDDVTGAYLAAISRLSLSSTGIRSLKTGDFAGLTNLQYLYMNRNSISDISALENLTSLTNLALHSNSISDISALENLTSLTNLNLMHNSISDISALSGLTSLTHLGLSGNSISNISVLSGLTSLKTLLLSNNSISDISVLEHLTSLKDLGLYNNSISNISALEDLTTLKGLGLSKNSISNISALEDLTAMEYLYLGSNSITDISALEDLTKLHTLYLYDNSISDISALENLTALRELQLHDNSISDISALEGLTRLVELKLADNSISDYGPLRRLKVAIELIERHPGLPSGLLTLDITIPAVANNNVPVFTDGDSTTRSIAENTAAGTNIGTAVAATDADTADTLTYHLGGTDASSFRIVRTSGQLQTSAALDHETKNSYTVTVAVSDGRGGSDSITVTITVTDVIGAAPSVQTPPALPDTTALLSNFPNPFNPETWIPYQLAEPAAVTITIYDVRGRVVRTLLLGNQPAGMYRSRSKAAHWDGRNHLGEQVATGVYFYTLKAGDYAATRKLLIRK